MISTRGRYAIRVMLDLAEHGGVVDRTSENPTDERGSFIPLSDIAERQGISQKYLEIILKVLVKNKFLQGLRGKGGGYKLMRSPRDYTVGEILTLTEGNLAIVSCLTDNDAPCLRKRECMTFPMWQKFDQMTHDYFFGITLADLLRGNSNTISR